MTIAVDFDGTLADTDATKKFYAEFVDFDFNQVNDWITKNVLDNLFLKKLYPTVVPELLEKQILKIITIFNGQKTDMKLVNYHVWLQDL